MIEFRKGIVTGKGWDPITVEWANKYYVSNAQYAKQKRMGFYAKTKYSLYHKKGNNIFFPKGILSLIDEWDLMTDQQSVQKVIYPFKKNLHDRQQKMLEDYKDSRSGLIIAGTGKGKSYALAGLIHQKQVRTLVVCPKKVIMKGLYEKFCEIFGEEYVCTREKYDKEKPICIIIGNSLGLYWEDLDYDMMLVDEAHMNFISKSKAKKTTPRLEIYARFPCQYFFGVTATPESEDVHEKAFELVFGKRRDYGGSPMNPIIYECKHDCGIDSYLNWQDCLTKLYENEGRTNDFCDMIKKVMKDREMGVVFCDRIELAENIRDRLNTIGFYSECFTGKTKNRDEVLENIKKNKGVLVATWQTLGVGFDCKDLDTAFYFSQLKFHGTVAQLIGRILRAKEGKRQPLMVDRCDKIIRHQFLDRKKAYRKYYNVETVLLDEYLNAS